MSQFLKDAKRWLPGALVSIIAIAVILYFVDLQRLWEAIQTANYGLLAISVAMGVIWLAMRAVVWRTILQEKATYRDSFLTICEGYFLNNIMPFRLGEIGRAFLLARKSTLNFMEVFPTIVIERSLDLVFSAAILLSAIPFVVKTSGAEMISIMIGVIVILGLFVLYILARNSEWTVRQVERFPALQKLAAPFLAGLSSLTDGRRFLLILGLMAVNWVWAIFQFFFTIKAFFPNAPLPWALFGIGAAAFGGAVPSAPGAVGTYEAALGGALTLLSSDEARSVAVAITAHVFNYLITGILGIYALSTEGETLSSIYHQLRRRQEEKPAEIDPQL